MNIQRKIEEIRQKPERERLYWVWGLTLFFTLVTVFFWLWAVKSETQNLKNSKKQENIMNEFQKPKKSIKEATQEIQNIQKTIQKRSFQTGSEYTQ